MISENLKSFFHQTFNKTVGKIEESLSDRAVSIIVIGFTLVLLSWHATREPIDLREPQDFPYTIKITSNEGKTVTLYANKTIEIANGVLYVCPVGTFRCSNDKTRIIVSQNFIVERQR